jgi:hypothetical protein
MLQVLCQILGTDDIALVQTWLAASHKAGIFFRLMLFFESDDQ